MLWVDWDGGPRPSLGYGGFISERRPSEYDKCERCGQDVDRMKPPIGFRAPERLTDRRKTRKR